MSFANDPQIMLIGIRGRQFSPDRKQFMLHLIQFTIDRFPDLAYTDQSDRGIQFIYGTVSFDAYVIFANSGSTKKTRAASITGSRINFHIVSPIQIVPIVSILQRPR